MERISIAIARRYCCSFLMFAQGGEKAIGVVELFRTDTTAGALTYRNGSIVQTASGKEFITTENATFGALDLGPVAVDVEAITEGYEWNVLGSVVTAGGETLPGDIDTIRKGLVVDTSNDPTIDLSMQVRNTAPTSDGQDKCLDARGQEVGLPRRLGEGDEEYRFRIFTTPDTISPEAIKRGANAILRPFDEEICLREVGTPLLPGLFYDAGSSSDSPQVPANNYAYDMDFTTRPEDRFKLYLSTLDYRGFFLVGVPRLVEVETTGLVYDGTTTDVFQLKNAHDTVSITAPNAAYDGITLLSSGTYSAIYDIVAEKKAGGVGFELYIEDVGCF
jgi:hypothetical protein